LDPNAHPAHIVLVVDDDNDLRDAFTALLTAHGFDVQAAPSAKDALRRMEEGFRPCVVLIDLRRDGLALAARMRADDAMLTDIAIIFVSDDPKTRKRAHRLGIDEVISNPILEPHALIAAVGRHCRRRSGLTQ
jgi:DNA-binding response OmpR family regulator